MEFQKMQQDKTKLDIEKNVMPSNKRATLLSRLPKMAYISERWSHYLNTGAFVVLFKDLKGKKDLASKVFAFEDYNDDKEEALFWAQSWRDDLYV
jgi:hypothetical protein